MVCIACAKQDTPPPAQGPKKPRLDITVWLDPHEAHEDATSVTVTTRAPPKARQMLEREGLHLAIIGVPAEVDPVAFLNQAIPDAEFAGSNATIVVSTR